MEIECDHYKISFNNCLDLFKFDEEDKSSDHYHGVTLLKAVDIIAEFEDKYYFIELKGCIDKQGQHRLNTKDEQNDNYEKFKEAFIQKYKDSLLFRAAEGKFDKPITYICFLNFDSALVLRLNDELKQRLPKGKLNNRWQKNILDELIVMNEQVNISNRCNGFLIERI